MSYLSFQTVRTLLAVALCASILAVPAEGTKKKKKKKKKKSDDTSDTQSSDGGQQSDPGPVQVIRTADGHLLAYSTVKARQALEPAIGESHPSVLIAKGRVLEQEKRYDEAIAELNRAADRDASHPAALVYLGETYLHADRQGPAKDAFARAEGRARKQLAANASDVEALYYLGVAEQRQQRYDEALATLGKARTLDPGHKMVLVQIGVTHAFKKDWQQAVDSLSQAIKLDSGLAYAYYYRGLAAGQINRKDLMVNDLDRFLAMAPKAPEAARARKILESI